MRTRPRRLLLAWPPARPRHPARLAALAAANALNAALAAHALLSPTQFSAHLLHLLLANGLLYFAIYCGNKVARGERFHALTLANLAAAAVAWCAALYFFAIEIKHWEERPAVSREANRPCILLNV